MTRVNRSHSAAWIFMDTLIMNDAHTQYVTADVTIPSGPFLSICGTVMYCHYGMHNQLIYLSKCTSIEYKLQRQKTNTCCLYYSSTMTGCLTFRLLRSSCTQLAMHLASCNPEVLGYIRCLVKSLFLFCLR